MSKPLVKACCIASLSEANNALSAGVDWLGFVSEMPSGPGVISLELIGEIVSGLPDEARTILLTSKRTSNEIIEQHRIANTWGIQLVDKLAKTELQRLRSALKNIRIIQVIHVQDNASISEASSYAGLVDFILLDSGKPNAKIRTLGGTGQTHDWQISRQICAQSSLPVFLAGGLNPENISQAVLAVRAGGYDVCSGVRSDGRLDRDKLDSFLFNIRTNAGDVK